MMGKLNTSFVDVFGEFVDTIMNDVAYFSNTDSQAVDNVFFPLARHKSWFDGHSFASGLFPFGNGKSQESTSEAINCYYGAYLWSLVRHGAALEPDADESETTNFLRLLLATEIRSAKTYWHMMPPENSSNQTKSLSALFNPVFLKEGGMNGNLGMLDGE
jgi:endo-1,3(4)-beta-glucanase